LVLVIVLIVMVLGLTAVATQGTGENAITVRLVRGQPNNLAPAFSKPLNLQPNPAKPAPAAAPALKVEGPAAYAPSPFPTIVYENFEGVWPTGLWSTFDNNGSFGGDVCWDDENWIAYAGQWSGWPAGNCADGLDPNFSFYPNDMESWATFGPFSLEDRRKANLTFQYWNESEFGFDFFLWCASPDNFTYYCKGRTGDSNGWKPGELSLKKVPGYGSMLDDPDVWIGFIFFSDFSIVDDGAFIDNVRLHVKGN